MAVIRKKPAETVSDSTLFISKKFLCEEELKDKKVFQFLFCLNLYSKSDFFQFFFVQIKVQALFFIDNNDTPLYYKKVNDINEG